MIMAAMRYIVVILMLSGCASMSGNSECASLVKESYRAGCNLGSVTQDDYLGKCEVSCK